MATVLLAAVASPGVATAAPSPGTGLQLPESRNLKYLENPRDYSDRTSARVNCVDSTPCTIESDGTAGSVRLNTFAPTSGFAHLWDLGSLTDIGIFDAQGNQVHTVENFECQWQDWPSGQMLSCSNASPDFKVEVPAGGSFGMSSWLAVFTAEPNVWAVGHDFADKNNPMTTVWDYTLAR